MKITNTLIVSLILSLAFITPVSANPFSPYLGTYRADQDFCKLSRRGSDCKRFAYMTMSQDPVSGLTLLTLTRPDGTEHSTELIEGKKTYSDGRRVKGKFTKSKIQWFGEQTVPAGYSCNGKINHLESHIYELIPPQSSPSFPGKDIFWMIYSGEHLDACNFIVNWRNVLPFKKVETH